MGFLGYLILGGVVYVIGFMIHLKILTPQTQSRHTIYIHAPNHDTAVIDVFCDDVGDISTAWVVRAGT